MTHASHELSLYEGYATPGHPCRSYSAECNVAPGELFIEGPLWGKHASLSFSLKSCNFQNDSTKEMLL